MKYLLMVFFTGFTSLLFSQMESAEFENLQGLEWDEVTSSLSKTKKSGWGEGSAVSANFVENGGDGEIEYVVAGESDTKAFGICQSTPSDTGLKMFYYGFYISKGTLYIINDGKVVAKLGKVKAGDELRIKVSDDPVITMFLHGKVVYSKLIVFSDYHIGALIYNEGGVLQNISTSFQKPFIGLPPLRDHIQYTDLTKSPSSFVKKVDDEFCFSFKYIQTGENDQIAFAVYNSAHQNLSEDVSILDIELRHGINQFCADVEGLYPGIYTLEVILPNGDKLYSKFQNRIGDLSPSHDVILNLGN